MAEIALIAIQPSKCPAVGQNAGGLDRRHSRYLIFTGLAEVVRRVTLFAALWFSWATLGTPVAAQNAFSTPSNTTTTAPANTFGHELPNSRVLPFWQYFASARFTAARLVLENLDSIIVNSDGRPLARDQAQN